MSGGTRRVTARCAPYSRPKRWSRSQRSSERNGGVGRDEDAPRIFARSLDNWPLPAFRSQIPDSGGFRARGDAPTGTRAVEVKSNASPGHGPAPTRESEPDGQRDQHSGLSPADRRWNPGRPREVHAGRAPDTSRTKSSAASGSPSELITPRLLNLRAAANYLGVSPW